MVLPVVSLQEGRRAQAGLAFGATRKRKVRAPHTAGGTRGGASGTRVTAGRGSTLEMELLPGVPAPVLSSRPEQPPPVPSGLPVTPLTHERTQVGVSEHSYLRMGRSAPCSARSGLPSTLVNSVLLEGPLHTGQLGAMEGPLLSDHCPWGSRG